MPKKCIDFNEILSNVVKMPLIRVILGLVVPLDLECEPLYVNITFFHGESEEEIYMEKTKGFKIQGKENMVCRLKKSLYGMKQEHRQWYKMLDSSML